MNKIAENLHNLEELQIEIWSYDYINSDHNVVHFCRNNKNIKVLVFNKMVITETSVRAISENCTKLNVLKICFPMLKKDIYNRYLIFRFVWKYVNK